MIDQKRIYSESIAHRLSHIISNNGLERSGCLSHANQERSIWSLDERGQVYDTPSSRASTPVPRPPLRSVAQRYTRGGEREDGVEDATLRDSNDPTNNNTKSFRKYRNTEFHRSFVPPSASSVSSYPSHYISYILFFFLLIFPSFLALYCIFFSFSICDYEVFQLFLKLLCMKVVCKLKYYIFCNNILIAAKRNISPVTKLFDSFLFYRSISETFDSKPRFCSRFARSKVSCDSRVCTSVLCTFHLTLARIHFPHPLAYFTSVRSPVCTLPSLFTWISSHRPIIFLLCALWDENNFERGLFRINRNGVLLRDLIWFWLFFYLEYFPFLESIFLKWK